MPSYPHIDRYHADLDAEIQAKFNRGYPRDNILFEDSQTAVLIQNGSGAMRAHMSRPGELHRLIRRFLDYDLPEIEEFRQARQQFKADLPAVLESPTRGHRGNRYMLTARVSDKAFAQTRLVGTRRLFRNIRPQALNVPPAKHQPSHRTTR